MKKFLIAPLLALALSACSTSDFFAPESVESRRLAECIAYDELSYEARELRWDNLSPAEQGAVRSLDERVEPFCDPAKPATVAGNGLVVTATARLVSILR